MKLRFGILILILLAAPACSGDPGASTEASPAVPEPTAETQELLPDPAPGPVSESGPAENVDCPEAVANPIGQSIADEFTGADYEQVMAWFCDGAAFEDIVVALETEDLTDTSAGEMLLLIAEGYSWEEVWFVVGLDD